MPEGVPSDYPVEVVWEEGQRFRGGKAGVPELVLDGARIAAGSPVDALLVALGSCAGIDVLEILEKRRTPATSLAIRIEFSRAKDPPRRLTDIRLDFEVGTESATHHVERAIELSISKYCSVAASFAPDTAIGWTARVRPPSGAGRGD